ncbi:MAG: NADH-quinone oxidoreductase subunit C [Candidatus Omnitrophica bacterium]|jgi:Ni,Fe-hydrogenase III component G|nr:NADH-quinone oxidoreductase subunit C [Candidatus Omnitrophota bacterium]
MTQEENIVQELSNRFNFSEGKIKLQRRKRISLETDLEHFKGVFEYSLKMLDFSQLCAITGLDEGVNLGCIYHFSRKDGITLNIKIIFPKENPEIGTITDYFPSAEIYERELVDLFGIKVRGLPEGNRYPLTDDWPKEEFPLRKDWKPKEQSAGSR